MREINEDHVVRRLEELVGWAQYIEESLTADQKYERGKLKVLDSLIGPERLARLREDARVLSERLRETVGTIQQKVPTPVV
jgi:hypothetical protein